LLRRPTNAQLLHKLSHSYMFRHYRVIFRELVINKLLKTNVSYEICGVKSGSYICDILLCMCISRCQFLYRWQS